MISVAGGAVARVTLYSRVAKQPITVSLSTLTEHLVCRIQPQSTADAILFCVLSNNKATLILAVANILLLLLLLLLLHLFIAV